jgi:CubicO group peptidase (beta-lactamase class C family)
MTRLMPGTAAAFALALWLLQQPAVAAARQTRVLAAPSPATSTESLSHDVLPGERLTAIEAAVSAARYRLLIPGLTVAIATSPTAIWAKGFGLADLENDVPASDDTAYRLASLSKPITAVAVMQLAEQGQLDLDAPIQRYVAAWPDKPWPVTARQLLGHQGGVRHVAPHEWGLTRHYTSLTDALAVFKDDPLVYQPGTRPLYSSHGYGLLGCAVEGASGMRFLDYLGLRVFGPAGVTRVRDDDVNAIVPHRAQGYRHGPDGTLLNSLLSDTSHKVPGGGLIGTAPEVARFASALLQGRLVRPATLALMLERQKTSDGRLTEYTLGFRVSDPRRKEAWHHGGQPRVSSLLYLLPERGLVIVVLANLEGVAAALLDLAREVAALAAPAGKQPAGASGPSRP